MYVLTLINNPNIYHNGNILFNHTMNMDKALKFKTRVEAEFAMAGISYDTNVYKVTEIT
jgi:hypothetical protein